MWTAQGVQGASTILVSTWPRFLATTIKGSPAITERLAQVCLNPWKVMGGLILARSHAALMWRTWFVSFHSRPKRMSLYLRPAAIFHPTAEVFAVAAKLSGAASAQGARAQGRRPRHGKVPRHRDSGIVSHQWAAAAVLPASGGRGVRGRRRRSATPATRPTRTPQ